MNSRPAELLVQFSIGILGPLLTSLVLVVLRLLTKRPSTWEAASIFVVISLFWVSIILPSTESTNSSNHDLRRALYWGAISSPLVGALALFCGVFLTRTKPKIEGFDVVIRK